MKVQVLFGPLVRQEPLLKVSTVSTPYQAVEILPFYSQLQIFFLSFGIFLSILDFLFRSKLAAQYNQRIGVLLVILDFFSLL